jgi:hypothetical protein
MIPKVAKSKIEPLEEAHEVADEGRVPVGRPSVDRG